MNYREYGLNLEQYAVSVKDSVLPELMSHFW
jgi:hypothetical protein